MSGGDCGFAVEGGVPNLKQVVPPTSAEAHNLKRVWIALRWRISESQEDKYNGMSVWNLQAAQVMKRI